MTAAVLDASAVLALLHEEPGASEVTPWIAEGTLSAVNAAEVIGKLIEAGMPEEAALEAVEGLGLDVMIFDAAMGAQTGILRRRTRALGLSLGDRACLANRPGDGDAGGYCRSNLEPARARLGGARGQIAPHRAETIENTAAVSGGSHT